MVHGDEFDGLARYAKFLALLGDSVYDRTLTLNRWFNAARRRLGHPYWSLSPWLKQQVKSAVRAIDRLEAALANEAKRRGLDGVVCGRIHRAGPRRRPFGNSVQALRRGKGSCDTAPKPGGSRGGRRLSPRRPRPNEATERSPCFLPRLRPGAPSNESDAV
ncbi:MAG: UDP-2,3-diacylglucosamine diphosphatase [Acetobacteraceae bacterium]|nr:UDP-2,3-diacylglucosamine diphosphatase [Acetobacteraceae bacterium]